MKVELALNAMVPAEERGVFSLRLILHGRARVRRPQAPVRRLRAGRLLPERRHRLTAPGSSGSSWFWHAV